jgi:hypothetical protein
VRESGQEVFPKQEAAVDAAENSHRKTASKPAPKRLLDSPASYPHDKLPAAGAESKPKPMHYRKPSWSQKEGEIKPGNVWRGGL